MNERSASVMQKEQSDKHSEEERSNPRRASKGKQKGESAESSYNLSEIRDLADLFNEQQLTEFEFENENIRIRLSRNPAPQIIQSGQLSGVPTVYSGQTSATAGALPATTPKTEVETEAGSDLHKILSPIVGTFYSSPAPDKEPYVAIGKRVTPETVVCIVEAMKLMNEIQAETSGEIVKIYVENGQPVEYGQPLFGIKK